MKHIILKSNKFIPIRILFVTLALVLSYWGYRMNSTNVLFFDNAKFNNVSDEKEEIFVLEKPHTVKFMFDSLISNGKLYVELRNENGQIIYKNNNNRIADNIEIELPKGTYYYYLNYKNIDGYFTFKGETL